MGDSRGDSIIPDRQGVRPGCAACATPISGKRRGSLSSHYPVFMCRREGHKMTTDLVVARGQQVVGLLLSTVPLAERMLLYNVALTAWIMLPERGLLQKSLQAYRGRITNTAQG